MTENPASSSKSLEWTQLQPPLSSSTLANISSKLAFTHMTPVQASTIPLFLTNKDVCVEACTGSGKTLAFLIPIIEIILRREEPLKKNEVGALIITPTRELALQIHQVAELLFENIPGMSVFLLIGGENTEKDIQRFRERGGSVVVGTPGRILDFMEKVKDFKLKQLEVLILDEADHLLDLGFKIPINQILSKLPKQRRTGLFSATQTEEVKELSRAGLRNPVKIVVKVENKETHSVQKIPLKLENYYCVVDYDERFNQLVHFLKNHMDKKVVVYFLTCASVDHFRTLLQSIQCLKSLTFLSFHGKVPHARRIETYNKFMSQTSSQVLLTTDVASRGLDIPSVDWIIQFDAPKFPDTFVHRIGRTARNGQEGSALLYLHPSEMPFIDFLKLKRVPLTEFPLYENVEDVLPEAKSAVAVSRERLDKSILAFVSFVRGYKEHLLNFIFRFNQLDLAKLAKGFALIKLPIMPELRGKALDFEEMNVEELKYKDKAHEKKRQKELLEKKQLQTDLKQKKKNKKKKKKEDPEPDPAPEELDMDMDEDEINEDYRALKQHKKKKINDEEFDQRVTGKIDVSSISFGLSHPKKAAKHSKNKSHLKPKKKINKPLHRQKKASRKN